MRVPLWHYLLGVTALVAAFAGGGETVPIMGRSQLQFVSSAEEVQMSSEAYKDILAKAKISTDPATFAPSGVPVDPSVRRGLGPADRRLAARGPAILPGPARRHAERV